VVRIAQTILGIEQGPVRLATEWRRMSAFGPKQTSLVATQMSAFGGKADMALGSSPVPTLPQHEDLGFQRRARSEQINDNLKNYSAEIQHPAEDHPILRLSPTGWNLRQGQRLKP
jgi:hypothetical protein